MIYLDNAATTLIKPPAVAQAVVRAMQTLGNCARGVNSGSLAAAETVYNARVRLAELFNCKRADHVVFTANATQALNTAIYGALSAGDRVITTELEHNSVLRPLFRMQAERGVGVDLVPADSAGNISYDDFERLITPQTKAIVCTHASNLTGNITDIARVGGIAREHGVLLIVDAAQTAGTRPVDMEALGADILCFTGHKGLMGPQGTGGMCVREGVELAPLLVGGTGVQSYSATQPDRLPTRLEAGTLNSHGIAGLSAAVDFITRVTTQQIAQREDMLTRRFYERVRAIPGVVVYGDFGREHAPIVALNIGDKDSTEVADALYSRYDIAVRAGAHCAPRMHEALGTRSRGAVRFSFSYFTTEQELDLAANAVEEIAGL